MIRKASEFKQQIVPNMCGGDGNVYLGNAFKNSEIKSKVCAFCTVTLEKGGSVGMHQHTEDDEIYYILSGKGEYSDNGAITTVGPGDVTFCPPGEGHGILSIGDEPLELIALILYE